MKKVIILYIILILGTSPFCGCIKKGTGILIIEITDKPPELNISKAFVTISSVSVHRTGLFNDEDNDSSSGWITIVNEPQKFDLILLQNLNDVLAKIDLTVGIYSQIRLYVDNSLVTIDGVEYDLKIPSKKVKIDSYFLIFEDETTTLLLDFDVHKSVHVAGKDKYILKPNIRLI
jgi:hypothetical protein